MPDFTNIPGTRAQVVDFGVRVSPPPMGTKVTIIGATDNPLAPLEDPYSLLRAEDLSKFDRANGTPSEISRKAEEAIIGGAQFVEIFVLSDGSGNRYSDATLTPSQRHTLLERAYELLLNHDVDIVVPCGVAIDMTGLTAGQNFAWQLANFAYQATKEYNACLGVIGVQPPTVAAGVTGVPTLAEQAAHVTAIKGYNTSGLQGVDFQIYDGTTDAGGDGIPDYYAFLATDDEAIPTGSPPWSATNVRKDGRGNPIDIGAYISVVASWGKMRNGSASRLYPTVGYYNACGDGAYAGLMSILSPEISTTNQKIRGMEPLRELSARQVNDLCGSRFVCFWTQPPGYVVASGMTGAHNISQYYRSDFVRLTTVRITHEAINVVRLAANQFIGRPNNAVNRSALEAAIDEALGKMQKRGALEGFKFSLKSTPTMRVLGQLIVDLTLIPAFELIDIEVLVGLSTATV